ncbi:MAG: rhomboid family intramembrane serine protease [Nakamurella multipartita]
MQSLSDGHYWTLLTSALFATDLATYVASVLLLIVGTLFERRHGSLRIPWMAVVIQAIGAGLGCWPSRPARCSTGPGPTTAAEFGVIGPSMLIAGLLMAFSGGCSGLRGGGGSGSPC